VEGSVTERGKTEPCQKSEDQHRNPIRPNRHMKDTPTQVYRNRPSKNGAHQLQHGDHRKITAASSAKLWAVIMPWLIVVAFGLTLSS
jgi:hypothetical protein